MTKRVFLIHGWGGTPDNHWFPWLSWELKARGFEVLALTMPHADMPKVSEWVAAIKDAVGRSNARTYFVGHSLGCIAVVRYIVQLPKVAQVGGCVFVAGFSVFAQDGNEQLQNLNSALLPGRARVRTARPLSGEAQARVSPGAGVEKPFYTIPEINEFISLPLDIEKAKSHCPKFVTIFSDNDGYVSMEKSMEFQKALGAKAILERGKGHFTKREGVDALPSVFKSIVDMAG